MIYKISEKTFFGELPNNTSGSPTEWGIIFNEEEYFTVVAKDEWKKSKASKQQLTTAREILAAHIRDINTIYNRCNEVFNLISSAGDPGLIEQAHPRGTQTFLSDIKSPDATNIYLAIATVDRHFTHLENLITGESVIKPNKHLYKIRSTAVPRANKQIMAPQGKSVSESVCDYLTGQMAIMDRLQLLVRQSRRDDDNAI